MFSREIRFPNKVEYFIEAKQFHNCFGMVKFKEGERFISLSQMYKQELTVLLYLNFFLIN